MNQNPQAPFIYKFGGASISSAEAVRNAVQIVRKYGNEKHIVLVASAMGKTTVALSQLARSAWDKASDEVKSQLSDIKHFHTAICTDLFSDKTHFVYRALDDIFFQLTTEIARVEQLKSQPEAAENFEAWHAFYDSCVAYGEFCSTTIIHAALVQGEVNANWLDSKALINTDTNHREAHVNWERTKANITAAITFANCEVYVVQGFIGKADNGAVTTLGLEGSDFSAAIFANCLEAQSVTLWKNVAGLYSADPNGEYDAVKIPVLSYFEVLQMANYGAKVIHPKTLKPLENKSIPLLVRSFLDPEAQGTDIGNPVPHPSYPPIIVHLSNLALLSLQLKDLSYLSEQHIQRIFNLFKTHKIKTYAMDIGLMTLNVAIGVYRKNLDSVLATLKNEFQVKWNEDMELLTVRHYSEEKLKALSANKEIYLEQRTRLTARLLYRTTKS